jgi:TRAP-type C4-dicarboxylate transport system permease small subunit
MVRASSGGLLGAALRAIDAACLAGAWIGAVACALLSAMLILEVVTTSFFNWSQPWAVEYSTYFQAMVLFAGSGWAFRQGAHIRVSLLLGALPPALARLLDLFGTVFALGLCSYLTVALVEQALRTIELGSRSYYPSETPLAWPQGFLAGAFVLLTLAILARLVRLLAGAETEAASESERPATVE